MVSTSNLDFTGLLREDRVQPHVELTEQDEEIADHLRCGKFEDLVGKAHKVDREQKAQLAEVQNTMRNGGGKDSFMCLTGRDGSFSKEQDFARLRARQYAVKCEQEREEANLGEKDVLLEDCRVKQDKVLNSAYASNVEAEGGGGATDELTLLREKRKAQMRREQAMNQHWKKLGHGVLREIASEREFFTEVKPHERSLVLIHDGAASKTIKDMLGQLATKHMETGMFHLEEQKAFFMLQLLDIPDGGLPVLFILRHGEVICRISRGILLDRQMDARKLEKVLKSRDAFGEGENGADDDESSEEEGKSDDDAGGGRRGGRLAFQRF
eukprot:g5246.t1